MMTLPIISPSRRVDPAPDGGAVVHVKPPKVLGELPELAVALNADQFARYQAWRSGAGPIHHLLYDLDDTQREILLSGLTDPGDLFP
jgi:hypothetical protein